LFSSILRLDLPTRPNSANPSVDSGTAKFDVFLSMLDTEQGLIGTLEYNTDLFNADHHPDAGTFPNLLGIVANPQQCLSDLPLLTPVEQQLLVEWNDTQTDTR